jgi:hypothetical protein
MVAGVADQLLQDALWNPQRSFQLRQRLFREWLANELADVPSHHTFVETSHLFVKLYADVAISAVKSMGYRIEILRLRRRDATAPVRSRYDLNHDPRTHPWLYGESLYPLGSSCSARPSWALVRLTMTL